MVFIPVPTKAIPKHAHCVTLWTADHWAPLSMGFSRQKYWNGLPFLPPGDFPNPRIEPTFPALAGRFFTTETLGKPCTARISMYFGGKESGVLYISSTNI